MHVRTASDVLASDRILNGELAECPTLPS
jgi:hypothetical protein